MSSSSRLTVVSLQELLEVLTLKEPSPSPPDHALVLASAHTHINNYPSTLKTVSSPWRSTALPVHRILPSAIGEERARLFNAFEPFFRQYLVLNTLVARRAEKPLPAGLTPAVFAIALKRTRETLKNVAWSERLKDVLQNSLDRDEATLPKTMDEVAK
jgi:hypothetical protein